MNEVWTLQERLLEEWQSLKMEQDRTGLFTNLQKQGKE